MADVPNSPEKTTDVNPQQPAPDIQISQPDPSQPVPSSSTPPPTNPSPSPGLPTPPLVSPSIQPYATPIQVPAVPPTAPSFRPAVPLPMPPQFSPIPNGSFQAAVQPPGVAPGTTTVSPGLVYPQQLNPNMRPYVQMPNAYMHMPQGMMPPPVSPS